MGEKTIYYISEAAQKVQVESHVLRYWEDELELPIMRNEMGHRYYTEQDIKKLQDIKQLKEQGLQLKAIRTILFRFPGTISENAEDILMRQVSQAAGRLETVTQEKPEKQEKQIQQRMPEQREKQAQEETPGQQEKRVQEKNSGQQEKQMQQEKPERQEKQMQQEEPERQEKQIQQEKLVWQENQAQNKKPEQQENQAQEKKSEQQEEQTQQEKAEQQEKQVQKRPEQQEKLLQQTAQDTKSGFEITTATEREEAMTTDMEDYRIKEAEEQIDINKPQRFIVALSKDKEETAAQETQYEDADKSRKAARLQYLLQHMITEAVRTANKELCTDVKESILKELDYQFRMQEERDEERWKKEEEHYRRIDEMIRERHKPKERLGRGKKKSPVKDDPISL